MAWNVSIDNVTDIDTLWDWDALIQGGTIIFMAGNFARQEVIAGAFTPQEAIPNRFQQPETGTGSFST